MYIAQVMTRTLKILTLQDTLASAVESLTAANAPFLPVTDLEGHIVGTFKLKDAFQALACGLSRDQKLEQFVDRSSYAVVKTTDPIDALLNNSHDNFIVVDDYHNPVGIVSLEDGKRTLIQQLNELRLKVWELEAAIESLHDGVGLCDGNGKILWVNSGYERVTGICKQEAGVGRNLQELVRENILSESVALRVIKTKKAQTITQKFKSGKEVLATGTPIYDSNREIVRVIVNFRDLTELNRLQREWEKSKELNLRLEAELKHLRSKELVADKIIANSEQMRSILNFAMRVAMVDSTVLITGESGVGKEVIAKVIHQASYRSNGPFIKINCAAIPEQLLESELFGYERGAFTGADKEGRPGFFEIADKGTLFLDEIGDMPLNLQVKLLRALDQQEVIRVGGRHPIKVDVRIIAATNSDLEAKVQDKTFREDLFYRLNVIKIHIPPLRERKGDIVPLALHFLSKFNTKYSQNKQLSPELLARFEKYSWPGNVRELEHTIERLMVVTEGTMILPEDFEIHQTKAAGNHKAIVVNELLPLKEAQSLVEQELLSKALQQHGSVRRAAKALGIAHSNVLRRLLKYNIPYNQVSR